MDRSSIGAALLAATAWLPGETAAQGAAREEARAASGRWSAMLFGGRMTENDWTAIVGDPGGVAFAPSNLAGLAVARRLGAWPGALQWEIEGQIVRHWRGQDNWEINAPLVARWSDFPWRETVETGVAFGLGLSLALGRPDMEHALSGDSSRLMTYWMLEASASAPGSPWSLVARIHHRSTAYGLFGDSGGSNSLVVGVRRRF